MGVSDRIEKLLKGLQDNKTARGIHQLPKDEFEDQEGTDAASSEQGTPRSSVLPDSADDSEDLYTSCSDSARIILQDKVTKMVSELCDSRAQASSLETQLELLKEEKAVQQTEHDQHIKQLESHMAVLQQQAEFDVAELKQRQNLIEFEVPVLEEQMKSLKDTLRDLNVSERLYAELLAIPEQRRSLRDHVLILAYQSLQLHRQEQESLRRERDTAREALVRANEEVQRQERDVQRTLAMASSQKKEFEKEIEATSARSERLETDLRDAIVQLQVLSAKGSLFDEVKEELDRCKKLVEDAERHKMIAETLAKSSTEEKQRLVEAMKEKDHTLELLKMDKAYLSREIKTQEDLTRKLEFEKERQQEKLRDLKRSKKDLYDRFVLISQESNGVTEQRVQNEISRVQDQARQEIDQARKEATETANRELKLLREMRDLALNDLEKTQAALQEIRNAYEELLLKCNEAQRVASLRDTDARSELKMKQFELDRLHMVHEEIKSSLSRSKVENEALTQKVKVLTEKYHDLERDMTKQAVFLQDAVNGDGSKETIGSTKEGAWVQKLSSAVTVLIQKQVRRMEERCQELQNALDMAEKDNAALMSELKVKNAEATKQLDNTERLRLLQRLGKVENSFQELLAERDYLEGALGEARAEKDKVSQAMHRLKDDLRRLLEARGSFNDLQRLVSERGILQEEVMKRFDTLKSRTSVTCS